MIDLLEKIVYNNSKTKTEVWNLKILVVFTGGTIGSTISGGYAVPDTDKRYKLISMYRENAENYGDCGTEEKTEFEMETPYQELSENNTCVQISELASYLNEKIKLCGEDNGLYDGIIITHGTDTLQYTAAALGYMFSDASIPIVLVSSNYVLDDVKANGLINFAYAVKFIRGKYGAGVFVSYYNTGGHAVIHRGTRLMEHIAYSDDVYSVKDSEYGHFNDGLFVKRIEETRASDEFFKSTQKCSEIRRNFFKKNDVGNAFADICVIKPFPGMRYGYVPDGIKAVLHMTYHSGTICSKSPDITEFAKDAEKRSIPIYIIGAGDSVDYDSVRVYREIGFETLPVAALPAMLIKLWLSCIMFSDRHEISRFMLDDIAGDINLNI